MCEKVALNQFTQFMKAKKRLTEHQSGNKAMHSTETMNVMVTDQMLQAMDDKKLSIVVLLDFFKACVINCVEGFFKVYKYSTRK